MRFTTTAATLLILTPVTVCQTTTVFPSDFASREGTTSENRLPLSNGISRTQFMYDRRDLPIPAGRTISRIGFRQDDSRASTGKSIQLEIYMGGTTFEVASMTSNFANNYNATARTLVFGPAVVALPDFTTQTTQMPFWIQLSNAWQVNANENLLVEFVVTANNNANQAFNWYIDEGTYYTAASGVGTGCQTSAGQTPSLSISSSSYLGGSLSFSISRAPASSLIWLNMDFVSSPPIDVTPFGAPGCTLYVLPRIAVPGRGNTGGSASFNFSLPADPALFHTVVYGQCAIFDLFANSLGFSFSNGAQVTLGMYPLATTVTASGSASASSGSVRRNTVPISLFEWN